MARWTPDPAGVEYVTGPRELAAQVLAGGEVFADCDDIAALTASLAGAVAVPARFHAQSFRPDRLINHVRAELRAGGRWIHADPFGPMYQHTATTASLLATVV